MRTARAFPLAAAFAAACLAPASPAADPDGAEAWLLQASEAARHATFEGVLVYHDADMMETMRIAHRLKDGREQERLTSISGASRDVLREDDHVTCIVDQDDPALIPGKAPGLFPTMSRATLAALAGHYDIRDLGPARVAGRACRGVALEPRDALRYGVQVWADAETGVPLKVRLVGPDGRAIEEMMFTEVRYPDSLPDDAFRLPAGARKVARPDPRPGAAAGQAPDWLPAELPPGFRLALVEQRPMAEGGEAVDHALLSDGLAAVSIFRAAMRIPEHAFRGLSRMGAMNAYGRLVGSTHFTVVGEVPAETVRRIGDAIRAD